VTLELILAFNDFQWQMAELVSGEETVNFTLMVVLRRGAHREVKASKYGLGVHSVRSQGQGYIATLTECWNPT
jgi:hypothetical protein